jgi:hypothetical protein
MSPFTQMAEVLASKAAWPAAPAVHQHRVNGRTKTDSIRDLLREATRPMTAAEIAYDLDLPSSCTVWLLMKYDMQKGRVMLSDGTYRWNREYDQEEAIAIQAAVKLLKRAGYQVKKVQTKSVF